MTEHVFIFFQKIPERPQNIVGKITGKFKGEGTVSGREKKVNGNIDGEFDGSLEKKNRFKPEKSSKLDNPEYKYTDNINYNTSIMNAVHHHLNKESSNGESIKFSTIINFYDSKSKESNKKTTPEMLKYLDYDESKKYENDIPDNFINIEYSDAILKDYTKLLKKIYSKYQFKEESCVHIAINGGQRDTMMFIATLTQILSHKNVQSHMYYEDLDGIVTEKNISYYDLLRAVDVFTETGNPYKLIKLYKKETELNDLLKYMRLFNEKIQVCRKVNDVSNTENNSIQSVYRSLIVEIDKLQQLLDADNTSLQPSLALILPNIKKAFVNEMWNDDNQENPQEIDLLNIIKWCHDNNLITIGFFIFRAEMIRFIENCNNFLNVEFKDADDLPSIERKNIVSDSLNRGTEEENDSRILNGYLKIYNAKQSFSERLDALIILFTAYVNDKIENDEELKNFGDTGYKMKYDERKKKIKEESLRQFGFVFEDHETEKVYRIITVCSLIRRIRNTLAHSDGRPLITKVYKYLADILDDYDNRLKNMKMNQSLSEEITIHSLYSKGNVDPSDENFYQVCHVLLGFLYEDMYEHYKNTKGAT